MMMLAVVWLLLVQGTGSSSGPVVQVGPTYVSKDDCETDGATLKKKFWVSTMCLDRKDQW